MTTRTFTVDFDDEAWGHLDRLAEAEEQTLEQVVGRLLDHVQQGVYRSGAWERDWLEHAIDSSSIEKAYLPELDPKNFRGRKRPGQA